MRKVRAGETIIKEGDLGDEMYIVDRSAQHSTAHHRSLCYGLQFQLSHFTILAYILFRSMFYILSITLF